MNLSNVRIIRECNECDNTVDHGFEFVERSCDCEGVLVPQKISFGGNKKEIVVDLLTEAVSLLDENQKGESGFRDALESLKNGMDKNWEYFQGE